ncbi:glycosyltransferase family 4 protein [Methylobacillus caricis]|uniref:glycosyltransferase family 4 protein n=1 Tax=Methylobacillus caricis TaxID=1971611 RepID=UPI001D00170C|nr:glycosyltransferase family 4 protein [Methylobacillus caricis]MCB5187688.1 glycosyltransferase family 4 protein [Methylobacillus caricis]
MVNTKPKILFFIAEDWFACSHWLPLITGTKLAGFDVVLVTNVTNHEGELEQLGIRVIPLNIVRRSLNPFSAILTVYRLATIYRKERPEICHHIAIKPMLLGSIAAALTKVRHRVNWVAGLGWLFISQGWFALFLKRGVTKVFSHLLKSTEVIVENGDDAAVMQGMGMRPSHITLIRGAGVDTRVFAPQARDEKPPIVVVLPARMLWDKGIGEFVEAAAMLKAEKIDARFVLVGGTDAGNLASIAEAQLRTWQALGHIEWWGRRDDMPKVLEQANIVCLPSYREGLPKALLEAASSGKPIVTTNVPGCREVVQDGYNGILVPAKDAIKLAEALRRLILDHVMRQRMGHAGREMVLKEFSQEYIVRKVLSVYKRLINE